MSETPRTDAALKRGNYPTPRTCISPDFARVLEVELNQANGLIQNYRDELCKTKDELTTESEHRSECQKIIFDLRQELAQAKDLLHRHIGPPNITAQDIDQLITDTETFLNRP